MTNFHKSLIIILIIIIIPFPVFADNGDYIPIDIDGYYDDWDDKPHTEVYDLDSHKPKINMVSLHRDEENAYVHIVFARKNKIDITSMLIYLDTNLGSDWYHIVPDFLDWVNEDDSSNSSDSNTSESNLLDQESVTEGEGLDDSLVQNTTGPSESPGSVDQNTNTDQSGAQDTSENTDQGGSGEPAETTDNNSSTNDQSNGTDSNYQNLYSNMDHKTYFLTADNDNNNNSKAGTSTDTADENNNNGQSNGSSDESDITDTDNPIDDGTDTTQVTDGNSNNGQGDGSNTSEDNSNNSQGDGSGHASQNTGTYSGQESNNNGLQDHINPHYVFNLGGFLDQMSNHTTGAGIVIKPEILTNNSNSHNPKRYGTWDFTVWDGLIYVGYGYFTRAEGEPDELELFIPLSSINHHYEGITEISMVIFDLGPQIIMCTGVATGPYVGVAIGAGIAMAAVGAYTYKKKRASALMR